jgi:uncharacterized protein
MTESRESAGESNLSILLKTMRPSLHESPFGFYSVPVEESVHLLPTAWGVFREAEGVTLILPLHCAKSHHRESDSEWALITLNVHSALTAVGFLAAISAALASANISLNAVSAYYHDHLFVPWASRQQALAILAGFSEN